MANKLFIKERLIKGLMEEDDKKIVGGVLIKCAKTDRVFLLLRNDKVPSWALMSGGIDKGENVLEGLKREMMEELFVRPGAVEFKAMGIEHIPAKNMEFHYFEGLTNSEFKPILDSENLNYGWFSKDNLPSPLFKGLAEKIAKI
jgi:8-oxo-dGTP pyrophosphatase MutT (NUDIX family)